MIQCSWAQLKKYKIPVHKTMRIEMPKKILFMKMCSPYLCCAIDEDSNIKIIDVDERDVRT